MDQYECYDIDQDLFMTRETPRSPAPDVLDGDGLSQQLHTSEAVAMVDIGPHNQSGDHGIGLDLLSATMEDSLIPAGNILVDNELLDLTSKFFGDNQGWNEFSEQPQTTGNVEALHWGEQGDPELFTEYWQQSPLLVPEDGCSAPMTLDPLLEQQTSLKVTEFMETPNFNDSTGLGDFLLEGGGTALRGDESVCTPQQPPPLNYNGAVLFPGGETSISQNIATSQLKHQPRFRRLVPKGNPPGHEPTTPTDSCGRKRHHPASPRTTRLINAGVPEEAINTFAIVACSEGAQAHLPKPAPASKRAKKQGNACKRCRDDRKQCSGGIPCGRCQQMVLKRLVYQRVQRLQSSAIVWTCYVDSSMHELNIFEHITLVSVYLMFTSDDIEAPFDKQESYEIIQNISEIAARPIVESSVSALGGLRKALVGSILEPCVELKKPLQSPVDDDVLEALTATSSFIWSILHFDELMNRSELNFLRLICCFGCESRWFFDAITTVLDNVRKRGSISPAARTALIHILSTMAFIVGPVFSMRLHQCIVTSLRDPADRYLETLGDRDTYMLAIANVASLLVRCQKIVCSGAFAHLSAKTAYWLQQLGVSDQVNLLEDERFTKLATKALRPEERQRSASEDTRLFYGRLKMCQQLETLDDNLSLLHSFGEDEVDRMIELAGLPGPESDMNYSSVAAIRLFVKIIEEETGFGPHDFDDESASDDDETDNEDDSDAGQSCH